MNPGSVTPLIAALRNPFAVPRWSLAGHEALVRQARSANVLARLGWRLDKEGILEQLPQAVRAHFQAAQVVSSAQADEVRREVANIVEALARTGVDIVLLKGAAYLLAALPACEGRTFSDIDILVPRGSLAEVEGALLRHGWQTTHQSAYDQRYYRRWMHELPPMKHLKRQTTLDVHHSIVPTTARLKPDSAQLFAASRAIGDGPRLRTLAPTDMVLHSATHLFLNEEFGNGLRDLSDLDSLLRHFGRAPDFWNELTDRAAVLDLERPLYYGLRYARLILGSPVPANASRAIARRRPPAWLGGLMDFLFMRALQPHHSSAEDTFSPVARHSLYMRAHWLRMPPLLLALHLTVKAFRRQPD